MNEMNIDLLEAAARCDYKEAKKLLEKGASKLPDPRTGRTPFLEAIFWNCDVQLAQLFIIWGGGTFERDNNGNTALHIAVAKENIPVVKLLLEKDFCVHLTNNYGAQPIHMAIELENYEIVKLLADKRPNLNVKYEGDTPLLLAVKKNNTDICEYLVGMKVKVNCKDKHGWTPVQHAAMNGNSELVKILGNHGSKIKGKNKDGISALFKAVESGSFEAVKYLISKGAKANTDVDGVTALHMAAAAGDGEMVMYLVENGAKPKRKNRNGETALDYARSRENNRDVIRYLELAV